MPRDIPHTRHQNKGFPGRKWPPECAGDENLGVRDSVLFMPSGRSLLVLGELDDEPRQRIASTASEAGFEPTWVTSVEAASAKLTSAEFDSLLVHLGTPGAARVCVKARGKLSKGRFPIIALADDVTASAFVKAFRAGADDIVDTDRVEQLSARLQALPRPSQIPPGPSRGEALIIDPDRGRSEVLERVLADAGFRVESVRDELAAKLNLGRPGIRLVVADAGLGGVTTLVDHGRKKASRAVWVIRTRPEQLPQLAEQFDAEAPISLISAYGPPDDVIFEANRLLANEDSDTRADPRVLHGAIATFSTDDSRREVGFTYNISPSGLYIRTLAAPEADAVSLELKPPGEARPVHIEGRVVRRRSFGPTGREQEPPGFAVELSSGDLSEWEAMFRKAYAEASGQERNQPGPTPSNRALRKPSRPAMRAVAGGKAGGPKAVKPPLRQPKAPPKPPSSKGGAAAGDKTGQTASPAARAPQSSVEEMLADALAWGGAPAPDPGSSPLTVAGTFDTEGAVEVIDESPPDDKPVTLQPAELSSVPPSTGPPGEAAEDEEPNEKTRPDVPVAKRESIPDTDEESPKPAEAGAASPDKSEATGEPEPADQPRVETADEEPAMGATAGATEHGAEGDSAAAAPAVEASAAETPASPPEQQSAPATSQDEAEAGPAGVPKGGAGIRVFVLIAAAAGIIGGTLYALSMRDDRLQPPRSAVTAAPPAAPAETKPSEPVATPTSEQRAPAGEATAEQATGAPERDAGAETETAETPADETPEPEPATEEIPDGYAQLYVESSLDTNVFVHGKEVGTTNTVVLSHCGPRFIRLGKAPGQWESEGVPKIIECGKMNRVKLE